MIFGTFKTYEKVVADTNHAELDISDSANSEKIVYINPGAAGVRVIFTTANSTDEATAQSYLLENGENYFEVGRALTRLSFYNKSGGEVKVSVGVGY